MHMNTRISSQTKAIGAAIAAVLMTTLAVTACSSDATPTPAATDAGSSGTTDSGSSGSSGSSGTPDSGSDTGPAAVQGCRSFEDRSDASASREIKWDLQVASLPEHCMQIKVGQKVTWGDGAGGAADFGTHPLTASGGDTPNPISGAGATGEATFDTAGTFGFQCGNHGSMVGAILVVP